MTYDIDNTSNHHNSRCDAGRKGDAGEEELQPFHEQHLVVSEGVQSKAHVLYVTLLEACV